MYTKNKYPGVGMGLLLLFIGCAKQGIPPGGPVDKSPPQIIRTIPLPNSTYVDPNIKVEIVFNEWLSARSVENAVFISPYVSDDTKIKQRGKKIKIIFSEPLKKKYTYVITLGTDIKDLHNNGLEQSFTLAFSTGGDLDQGKIKGQVYEKGDAKGIDVWAYMLRESDTIDPATVKPDYITQCDKKGNFKFTHIAGGTYRLFAVNDRMADRLYTKGEDKIGLTYSDAPVFSRNTQEADSLFFRMFLQDTLRPALIRAVSINRKLINIVFDESVKFDEQLSQQKITIHPLEDSLQTVEIENYFIDPNDNKNIHIITEPLSEGRYSVSIKGILDDSGNTINSEFNTIEFNAVPENDTTKPVITQFIPVPEHENVPLDRNIHLIFNESIDTIDFQKGFSLDDTLTGMIEGKVKWVNPAEMYFYPQEDLKSKNVYRINLSGEWIKDLSGNSLDDTLYFFKTLNKDTLSGISGKIGDPHRGMKNDIYVRLELVGSEDVYYEQKADSTGNFDFKKIMPGNYTISCFSDRDNNGVYSYGDPYPFRTAERFIMYTDTVTAKPRWPNAGNNFSLPSYKQNRE